MATITLDEFVGRLQNSVAKAQANIEKGNRGRLERLIELGQDGRSEAVTCSFVIDADPASGLLTHTVQLPLITLRPCLAGRVSELTLELKARVEESPAPRKARNPRRLRLVIDKRAASLRRRLHCLTIKLKDRQPGFVDINVNGVSLKSLGGDSAGEGVE